jgi:hypothetical protein
VNSTEDALTDALDAAAETIRQDTLRPLPGVVRNTRRKGWLAPLAAAVAVVLVAVLAVTLTGGQRGTSSGRRPASPSSRPAQTPRPQFYTETFRRSLQVRSVATGKLIGDVSVPAIESGEVWGVAAAPGGRTFYVVWSKFGPNVVQQPQIESFQVTGSGTVTRLRYVARGPADGPGDVLDPRVAVSPDGTELALTVHTERNYFQETDTIVVVDLRTGAYHLWRGGLVRTIKGASLDIWDLSWSGDSTLDFLASWCPNYVWHYCGSGSAQVRSLAIGPDGGSLAGSTVLVDLARFPDVVDVFADQQGHVTIMQVSGGGLPKVRQVITIDQVAVPGGAVIGTLFRHSYPPNVNAYGQIAGDPSGQYLMIWTAFADGWLHDGSLHPLPGSARFPGPGLFAW